MGSTLSAEEHKRLVLTQITAASVSFIASISLIVAICRYSANRLRSSYHRIIFSITLSGAIQSLSLLLGPLAVPRSTPQAIWALGNMRTCQMNGFFFSFTAGSTPMYMFGLCIYTVLKIKRNITDEMFTLKIEKVMHFIILLCNFVPCIIALATSSINAGKDLGSVCGFYPFPSGCMQQSNLFGECEPAIFNSSNNLASYSYVAIPIICLLGITGGMGLICWHVSLTARVPSRHNNFIATLSGNVDDDSSSRSNESVENESENDSQDLQEYRRQRIESNLRQSENLIRGYRKQLILQASWFILVFHTTFSLWCISNTFLLLKREPPMFLIYTCMLFYPLAGLFNVMLYVRQHVSSFRVRHPEYSWSRSILLVLIGSELPFEDSIESSITLTAWRITSTPFKVEGSDAFRNDLSAVPNLYPSQDESSALQ